MPKLKQMTSQNKLFKINILKKLPILFSGNIFPFIFIFDDIDDISLIVLYFVNISSAYNITI